MPDTNAKFIRSHQNAQGRDFGQIYQYEPNGNTVKVLWTAEHGWYSKNLAIDDAVEYAEENNIEIESIDFD